MTTLKVRNTLTNRLETFEPLTPGKVRMYVCGPTVYDYFHIGNARPFVVFDMVRRTLETLGHDVTYVQNITDIDDKIIERAREQGTDAAGVAKKYTQAYFEDLERLGVKAANHAPKATEYVPQIIEMIQALEARGMTYTCDGDVYYRVSKFPHYGCLSGKNPDDLRAGASQRTQDEHTAKKEHPADFALWKGQKAPDEPAWESPWGPGRPGWHIECSAMSTGLLGNTFDIHAGGEDLVFPHHENEIAQSQAATGEPFVRYWLHNAFLNIAKEETPLTEEQQEVVQRLEGALKAGETETWQRLRDELNEQNVHLEIDEQAKAISFKASKSLKNVPKLREVFARGYSGQVVRFFLLRTHYRSPVTFSWSLLDEARKSLGRWEEVRNRLHRAMEQGRSDGAHEHPLATELAAARERYRAEMAEDFNTSGAIGAAFHLISQINAALNEATPPAKSVLEAAQAALAEMEAMLGLSFEVQAEAKLPAEVQELLQQRAEARKRRDFAESDRIRDELKVKGYIVRDTRQGQTCEPA